MARAAKEALARAKEAEIDEADDEEEEDLAAAGEDEETAAEGNARASRRAAGSWRSRDISREEGKERRRDRKPSSSIRISVREKKEKKN